MRRLLLAILLAVAQLAEGAQPLPREVAPLSLGRKIPSTLAVAEVTTPFKGWAFHNEVHSETAKQMWQHFLPQVPSYPQVLFSLFKKQVAEIEFVFPSNDARALRKSIERELTKRHGKPRTFHLRGEEMICPPEIVSMWTDDFSTLVLVSSSEYGDVFVAMRLSSLAKNIVSAKKDFYSDRGQGEPCVRW